RGRRPRAPPHRAPDLSRAGPALPRAVPVVGAGPGGGRARRGGLAAASAAGVVAPARVPRLVLDRGGPREGGDPRRRSRRARGAEVLRRGRPGMERVGPRGAGRHLVGRAPQGGHRVPRRGPPSSPCEGGSSGLAGHRGQRDARPRRRGAGRGPGTAGAGRRRCGERGGRRGGLCPRGAQPRTRAPRGGADRRATGAAVSRPPDRRPDGGRRMSGLARRVGGYLRPHRGALAWAIAQVVLISAAELLKPWPLKVVIDSVLGGHALPWAWAARWSPSGLLLAACGSLVLIHAALGALNVLANYTTIGIGQRMVNALRSDLYAHLHRLSLAFHSRARIGDLLYRVTGDTLALQTLTMNCLFPAVTALAMLVGMTAIMLQLDG